MNNISSIPYEMPNNNIAYLVAIKCGNVIEQKIILANDVFDIEIKVRQCFKNIEWWEIRCNYGTIII